MLASWISVRSARKWVRNCICGLSGKRESAVDSRTFSYENCASTKSRSLRSMGMDLGIAGRKAIVCASSRGLGYACAKALAEAGCEVVLNGRNAEKLAAAAADLKKATGAKIAAVPADVASPEGQKALFGACPEPDILVNNNGGP